MDSKDRRQWIHSSKNSRELTERYDAWAKDYDHDIDEEMGWLGPRYAADYFERYVPKSGRVLDAGAGTGLAGVVLYQMGYRNIVAGDISPGMLHEARRKSVCSAFKVIDLVKPLDFLPHSFDGIIATGVFTSAHVSASAFDELIRITKPGAYIVYTLPPDHYREDGFREKQEGLEAAGKWQLIKVSEPYQTLPIGKPDMLHQIWVYCVA